MLYSHHEVAIANRPCSKVPCAGRILNDQRYVITLHRVSELDLGFATRHDIAYMLVYPVFGFRIVRIVYVEPSGHGYSNSVSKIMLDSPCVIC
jgi:hypothetical protein